MDEIDQLVARLQGLVGGLALSAEQPDGELRDIALKAVALQSRIKRLVAEGAPLEQIRTLVLPDIEKLWNQVRIIEDSNKVQG